MTDFNSDDLFDIPAPSDAEYHENDGFNQSTAWQLLSKSPRHAFEYRRKQAERRGKTDPDHDRNREIGTVIHKLLLGSTTDFHTIVVYGKHPDDYRTKAAQTMRAMCEARGVTPILKCDLERCYLSVNAVREQLADVFGIVLDGQSEQAFYWEEQGRNGKVVPCKAKLDHIRADGLTILDIKSGTDANPKGLMRRILDQGFHVQAAWYLRALGSRNPSTIGRARFVDVFIETTGLIMCTPVEITGSLLELGERKRLKALARYAECVSEGRWPGYTEQVLAPPAPEWVLKEEMAEE